MGEGFTLAFGFTVQVGGQRVTGQMRRMTNRQYRRLQPLIERWQQMVRERQAARGANEDRDPRQDEPLVMDMVEAAEEVLPEAITEIHGLVVDGGEVSAAGLRQVLPLTILAGLNMALLTHLFVESFLTGDDAGKSSGPQPAPPPACGTQSGPAPEGSGSTSGSAPGAPATTSP